jgi:hypothetical protein
VTTWVQTHTTSLVIAGAVAAAFVWYVLASVTGLIFHFMPAGPTLVAAWIARSAGDGPPRRGRAAAVLVVGALVALLMTLALAGLGRPLDDPSLTALAIAGGVGLGAWLLRPGARADGGSPP